MRTVVIRPAITIEVTVIRTVAVIWMVSTVRVIAVVIRPAITIEVTIVIGMTAVGMTAISAALLQLFQLKKGRFQLSSDIGCGKEICL